MSKPKLGGVFFYADEREVELWGLYDIETNVQSPARPLPATWTRAHILHDLGVFPSVSQARKNGWDQEIVYGHDEFQVNKFCLVRTFRRWPKSDEDEDESDVQ